MPKLRPQVIPFVQPQNCLVFSAESRHFIEIENLVRIICRRGFANAVHFGFYLAQGTGFSGGDRDGRGERSEEMANQLLRIQVF